MKNYKCHFTVNRCTSKESEDTVALFLNNYYSVEFYACPKGILYGQSSTMDALHNGWFSELSEELWPGQCFSLRVKEILHEEKSAFQEIKLIDT